VADGLGSSTLTADFLLTAISLQVNNISINANGMPGCLEPEAVIPVLNE